MTTLNSSRTSYASFALDPKSFFISYNFGLDQGARFTCQLYNKVSFRTYVVVQDDPIVDRRFFLCSKVADLTLVVEIHRSSGAKSVLKTSPTKYNAV